MVLAALRPESDRVRAALLFAGAALLYLLTASCSLDEWDSIQFALGVHDFNLWKHQPHPPGYPLYEFSGWFLSWFGCSAQTALTICSAFGGALFVASWFGILLQFFTRSAALLSALTIAVTPVVWLTSTKVLTDAPAAGFLAAELFFAFRYIRQSRRGTLILCGLAGAIATGFRPQDVLFAVIPLIVSLASARAKSSEWFFGFGVFFAGGLTWLVPTMWTQARLAEHDWMAYPNLLLKQWTWRFDKPAVYIGAGNWNREYFLERINLHCGGWLPRGLGLDLSRRYGKIGLALVVTGWIACLKLKRPLASFWKMHLAWAPAYVLMIFCCLPGDQRYYLPIIPLLVAPAVIGLWSLPKRWYLTALVLTGLLLKISAPLAWQAHREEAPPVRLIHYLQQRFPPAERASVWLCFKSGWQHSHWYGPEFHLPFRTDSKHDFLLAARHSGQTVFCDDMTVADNPEWAGAKLTEVAVAQRSPVIYFKHCNEHLYEVSWPQ